MQLDDRKNAEKYWEYQLPHDYLYPIMTSYDFYDQNDDYHIYPNDEDEICYRLNRAVFKYYHTSEIDMQIQILQSLKDIKVNKKSVNCQTLEIFKEINDNIELLKLRKNDCNICSLINELCEQYYNSEDENEKEKLLIKIKEHEMNGFQLLKFKEQNGFKGKDIKDITTYISGDIRDNNYVNDIKKIDKNISSDINLTNCYWCNVCGARKPNIYK